MYEWVKVKAYIWLLNINIDTYITGMPMKCGLELHGLGMEEWRKEKCVNNLGCNKRKSLIFNKLPAESYRSWMFFPCEREIVWWDWVVFGYLKGK